MVGWDAADHGTVESMCAAGELPHLSALRARGLQGRVAPLPGLGDDGCWATFATGVEPGVHGRFHHRQLAPGSCEDQPFRRGQIAAPAFWAALGDAGRRVAVLDVPKAPLAQPLNGMQLVDWLPHGEDEPTPAGWPMSVADEASAIFRPEPGFSCHTVRRSPAALDALTRQIGTHLRHRAALSVDWLGREAWDLFLTVFAESHCIGHHCWHRPETVRGVYREMDDALGQLVSQGGAEATVIVFSLIGMRDNRLGNWLADFVLQRSETLFAGTLLPANPRESPEASSARTRSAAFTVHTDSVATAIRINRAGREPGGRVPDDQFASYARHLTESFLALVDPRTRQPLVTEVVAVAERYPGPRSDAFADLLVVWDQALSLDAATSAAVGTLHAAPHLDRSGNHDFGGWFVAAGPGVQHGTLHEAIEVVDFAPSVAHLLGVQLTGTSGTAIELPGGCAAQRS